MFNFVHSAYVMDAREICQKITDELYGGDMWYYEKIRRTIGSEYYYETGWNRYSKDWFEGAAEEADEGFYKDVYLKLLEYIERGDLPEEFYILCY